MGSEKRGELKESGCKILHVHDLAQEDSVHS